MSDQKNCRNCGATFTKSRADVTVNCPACRAAVRDRIDRITQCVPPVLCDCGKTVLTDGFGKSTGQTCPRDCAPTVRIRVTTLCEQCGYSKSARCSGGEKVCADCGAAWPMKAAPTAEQRSTVDYFSSVARETGATVSAELEDGTLWLTETRGANWDHERTTWIVRADGNAEIQ